MDKVYSHKDVEEKIYKVWETSGYFKPEINPKGKPYCVILPPPNANGSLHFGHALLTVGDVLIRYHRMRGDKSLWLPGTDHAGIETQYVFEKKMKDQGKSRMDFDSKTLYEMIRKYVSEHKGDIEKQLRRLGFSLDWSRKKYTLDPDIVKLVCKTFKRMYDEKLLYRDYRLVNYCTFDGTSFSDLEVVHEERVSPLYYIKYGPLVLATTRPETKFGDTAVAVHPDDKRYKKYVGKELEIKTVLGKAKIKVIADEAVDPKFGTGVVKITPAHDFADFETGKKHNLPLKQVIGFDGKMNHFAGKFEGLYVKQARRAIIEEMQTKGLVEKIDENYKTRIGLCYKCKNAIEPLPLEQWFVKVKPLAEKAINVVKKGEIKIIPKNFEKQYYLWLENLRDWNISRQIVWGIRIPAWKNSKTGEWAVTEGEAPEGEDWEQDKDTLDTWFSSSQWPYLTLKTEKPEDFEKFYPTSAMETGYDILKSWVSRMIMMGIYISGKIPFKNVVLHGLVNDPYGKKMSKSKGNVVNPIELVDQYGADAVRFALIYGNATGNDQALSYPKLDAARKFTNKLWNMARFIEFSRKVTNEEKKPAVEFETDELNNNWSKKTQELAREVTSDLEKYNFNYAAEKLYDFVWHEFADEYIEDIKPKITSETLGAMKENFKIILKLLHPFMPFVTEEIYQRLGFGKSIMVDSWPLASLEASSKHEV